MNSKIRFDLNKDLISEGESYDQVVGWFLQRHLRKLRVETNPEFLVDFIRYNKDTS